MFYLISKIDLEKVTCDGVDFGERVVDKALDVDGCFPVNPDTHEWREHADIVSDVYDGLWYWCPMENKPKLYPEPTPPVEPPTSETP